MNFPECKEHGFYTGDNCPVCGRTGVKLPSQAKAAKSRKTAPKEAKNKPLGISTRTYKTTGKDGQVYTTMNYVLRLANGGEIESTKKETLERIGKWTNTDIIKRANITLQK